MSDSPETELVLLKAGYALRNREDAMFEAEIAGYTNVLGSPTLMLLDIDSPDDRAWALHMIGHFAQEIGIREVLETRSKSGNTHFQVRLAPPGYPMHVRALLEAAFGSDRKRAFLNWRRADEGIEGLLIVPKPREAVRIWPKEGTFEHALLMDEFEREKIRIEAALKLIEASKPKSDDIPF